jgi:2'-deoxynucleoside 5'-phosphate N-hydrolase
MQVFFTASIRGKKHYLPNYEKIINILTADGHSVISDHIIKNNESIVKLNKKEDVMRFQHEMEEWIKGADCVVAEVSHPSISVGYEISLAYNLGKPVLILYSEGVVAPSLLAYHKDEKIVCEEYTSDSLKETISAFINYVKGAADMRFTFFITARIAKFLETISKKHKVPKSVYLRHLIEGEIRKQTP